MFVSIVARMPSAKKKNCTNDDNKRSNSVTKRQREENCRAEPILQILKANEQKRKKNRNILCCRCHGSVRYCCSCCVVRIKLNRFPQSHSKTKIEWRKCAAIAYSYFNENTFFFSLCFFFDVHAFAKAYWPFAYIFAHSTVTAASRILDAETLSNIVIIDVNYSHSLL